MPRRYERRAEPRPPIQERQTIEERRTQVAAMMRDGWTVDETARQLSVAHGTVVNDRQAILAELKNRRLEDAQQWRDVQTARLEHLLQLVMTKLQRQMTVPGPRGDPVLDPARLDLETAREARNIIKDLSTLTGANSPVNINVNITLLEKIVALVMNQGGDPTRLFNAVYEQLLGAMDISEMPDGGQLAPGEGES